jgi:hypothetical protein
MPSDPGTDLAAQAAVRVIAELFKSSLKGLSSADDWLRNKTKGYDPLGVAARKYVSGLYERYSKVRILGMSEPILLHNVYVRVNILRKITKRARYTIEELNRGFDREARSFGTTTETVNGVDIVRSIDKVLVLGKPGAGKTTFLKHLLVQYLTSEEKGGRIPIFVSLKDWADADCPLPKFIVQQFDICGFPEAEAFVTRMLSKGKCIVLLDGLDEVADKMDDASVIIRDFNDKYPLNKYVISCRIAAYNYIFEKFTDVEIADFSREQVKAFVFNWFGRDSSKAQSCWTALQHEDNAPVMELASIPLLLTMLCIAYDELLAFPPNRAELYKEAVDALLKKWDASRAIDRNALYYQMPVKRKEDLLSKLAYFNFIENRYFVSRRLLKQQVSEYLVNLPKVSDDQLELDSEVVIDSIEAQHGLIIERAKGIYSFSHLTIQEYFTAKHVVANQHQGLISEVIEENILDDRWRVIFLLISGMLSEADQYLLTMQAKADALARAPGLQGVLAQIAACAREIEEDEGAAARSLIVFYVLANVYNRRGYVSGRQILNSAYVPNDPLLKALEYAHALVFGLKNQTFVTTRSRDLMHGLAKSLEIDYDFDREWGIMFAKKLFNKPHLIESMVLYLKTTRILVDCLYADAYVSLETRERLLRGVVNHR